MAAQSQLMTLSFHGGYWVCVFSSNCVSFDGALKRV